MTQDTKDNQNQGIGKESQPADAPTEDRTETHQNFFSDDYSDDPIDYDVDPESLLDDVQRFEGRELPAESPVYSNNPEDWALTPNPDDDPHNRADWHAAMELQAEPAWDAAPTEAEKAPHWPVGLILVGVFALLLLGAGGYGVMQDRAELQEEIRSLRAAAATSASPQELAENRAAQRVLDQNNDELRNSISKLELENRSLADTAQGLEAQLASVQGELDALKSQLAPASPTSEPGPEPVAKPAVVVAAPKTSPAPTTVAPKSVAGSPAAVSPKKVNAAPAQENPAAIPTSQPDGWFVNFGSYRYTDTANKWAQRLSPLAGQVVVVSGEKGGTLFYRVRVSALASKAEAQAVARQLEQEYDLSRLWIGQQ